MWVQCSTEPLLLFMYSLCDCCTLTLPCSNDVYALQTDASSVGISGILSVYRNAEELLVTFYSWQLRASSVAVYLFSTQCLAALSAIKHFEIYLHGICFTVETDHKSLEHLLSSTRLNAQLTRCALYLQQFSMTIR